MNAEIKERIAAINSGIIPEGYKKTKVGIVPAEWEEMKLEEISDYITKGATPTTYGFTWLEEGIPFFRNDSIKNNTFIYGDFSYISEEANKMLNRSEVKRNDIVIAITGDIGKVGMIPDEIEKANINQHLARIRIIKKTLPFFVYQFLSSDGIQKVYKVIKTGISMPQLSLEQIRDTLIILPPLPEQHKIAEILSTQDKLIELQEKKIEQLKELKKAYLQKMFPQKGSKYPELRFKGFTDPWEQRKLSDILERRVEHRQQSEEYPRLAFASGQGVIPLSERKTNNREQLTKDEFTKNYLVTELDDIVYNPANVKYGAIDRNKYGRGLISPIYITFTTAEIPGFIERIVSSHEFQQRALKFEEGTVIKRQSVNPNDFVTLKILLSPHREEQEKISALFDNLDSLITLHQRKSEQEKQKKKALMQLLLTGIVRTK